MEWSPGISMQNSLRNSKYEANRLLTGVKYTEVRVHSCLVISIHDTTNYSNEGPEPLSISPFVAHLDIIKCQ